MTSKLVHQQIGLLRHADVADFEIGAAVALTREHPLVSGGETSVVTNALQRPQDMVMRAGPIRSMMEAGVDMVPGTFTTHEVPLTGAWHVRKRSEGRVVGEPEELMEEGNIVLLRDFRPPVVHARPIWPQPDAAGEKERRGCLPPSSSLRCGILPCRAEVSSSMGTDWV